MSDQVEQPNWQDGAPEESHGVLTDPSQLSGENWVPEGSTVTDQAQQIDGVSNAVSIYDSGKGVVDAATGVDNLTDWDGLWNLATTFGESVESIQGEIAAIGDFMKVLGENPLGWLSGTIVDFLLGVFQPLDELLKLVSGNDALMANSAEMWGAVSDGAPQVADFITQTGEQALQGWEGEAADAARTRVGEVGIGLQIMGYLAVGMKFLMTKAAELAQAAYEKVKGYIADGVEWVLTRIVAYLAASWATLGAAVPVAVADTVRKVCSLLMDAYNWVKRAIDIFISAVQSMQMVQQAITKIKPVLDFLQNIQPYVQGAMVAKSIYDNPTGFAQATISGYSPLAGDLFGQTQK